MRPDCSVAEFQIFTNRLILREWRDSDVRELHRINSDPRVMEFLGQVQSQADVRSAIKRQRLHQEKFGHCFWAIELRATRQMIGFCGIQPGPKGSPLEGLPEIGWRLARDHWHQGFASESAQAALDWYWSNRQGGAVWAITVPANARSLGLMARLGMERHHDLDFDHPAVPEGSMLKRHVTYSIAAPR